MPLIDPSGLSEVEAKLLANLEQGDASVVANDVAVEDADAAILEALRELQARRVKAQRLETPSEGGLTKAEASALEQARHAIGQATAPGEVRHVAVAAAVRTALEELADRRLAEREAAEAAEPPVNRLRRGLEAVDRPVGIGERLASLLAEALDPVVITPAGLDVGRIGLLARALRDHQEARRIEVELTPRLAVDAIASQDRELEDLRERLVELEERATDVLDEASKAGAAIYFERGSALEAVGHALTRLENTRGVPS
jgi:hypothetical protein